ncbi:MAG: hypothetical protein AAFY15_03990 [Cyanobacteria bacterium J06648_11]
MNCCGSPFPVNATLTFQTRSREADSINANGNPAVPCEPVTLRAYLKPASANVADEFEIDLNSLIVSGRLVSPKHLPENFDFNQRGEATIDNLNGRSLTGEIRLRAQIQSAYGTHRTLGDKIQGLFTYRQIWGDCG